jgi:CspA family cold shock protein
MQGTICAIKTTGGFGFIARPDGEDIFFHASDLINLVFEERLLEQRVQFEIVDTERGPRARNVRPAD